jgi:hypothetical protein
MPELQSRGLFRAEYEGKRLRENMGLDRPKSRYAAECSYRLRRGMISRAIVSIWLISYL